MARTDATRLPLPGSAATHASGLAAPLLLPPVFFNARAVLLPGWSADLAARQHGEGLASPPLVLRTR